MFMFYYNTTLKTNINILNIIFLSRKYKNKTFLRNIVITFEPYNSAKNLVFFDVFSDMGIQSHLLLAVVLVDVIFFTVFPCCTLQMKS